MVLSIRAARTAALSLLFAMSACADAPFEIGGQARLEATPGQLEFPVDGTPVGDTTTQRVMIQNTGNAPVDIERVFLRDVSSLDSGLVSELSLVAAPAAPFVIGARDDEGDTIYVDLGFTRLDDEPREATLVIVPRSSKVAQLEIPILATRGRSWLVATPEAVRFDGVQLDQVASEDVRLLNTGGGPLTIARVDLVGDGGFSVDVGGRTLDEGVNALDTPLVIAGHSQQTATVSFSPELPRGYRGRLVVFGDSANSRDGVVIPLVGNDTGPCVTVNPTRASFGPKTAGTSSTLSVEVSSCGSSDLVIDAITLADEAMAADPALAALSLAASSPAYTVDTGPATFPAVLAPGATLRFDVSFLAPFNVAPDAQQVAHVVLDTNAFTRFHAVEITGSAVGAVIPGCDWTGGATTTHDVAITVTADDQWSGWIDGAVIAEDMAPWHHAETYEFVVESGCHVLGIHAWDTGAVISGLIASVAIDGQVTYVTGDAKPEWNVTGNAPGAGWHAVTYDDDSWRSPSACANTSPWTGRPAVLVDAGAEWVWWNEDCRDLTAAWFRLVFTVP